MPRPTTVVRALLYLVGALRVRRTDQIRYMSLHDNTYIRYFGGHTKRCAALHGPW
jgi:hypothetical protein